MADLNRWISRSQFFSAQSILADLGTEQMEFIGLSQRTVQTPNTSRSWIVAKAVNSKSMNWEVKYMLVDISRELYALPFHYTILTVTTSFYEYMLKAWIQGNKTKVVKHYRYTILVAPENSLNVCSQISIKKHLGFCKVRDSEIKMGMTGATMATTEEGAYALGMIELHRARVRKENQKQHCCTSTITSSIINH